MKARIIGIVWTVLWVLAFCSFIGMYVAAALGADEAAIQHSTYLPGDIFATRNATEEENSSPGYWNHLAIYVGEGLVVEAQQGQGVIYSELPEFIARYPEIRVLRLRVGDGQLIADEAWKHVGTPYALLASLPVHLRRTERGNNCVSVVRRSAGPAIGRDPRWFKPDDTVADPLWEICFGK